MLARLDHAISEFRYAPVPLDKEAVVEAIAFLEWLRDDNFTFLGMREFRYSGGSRSGKLIRDDSKGLGILADPDVRALDINVDTYESVVVLQGKVTSADQRRIAERVARDTRGVKGVRNELTVRRR